MGSSDCRLFSSERGVQTAAVATLHVLWPRGIEKPVRVFNSAAGALSTQKLRLQGPHSRRLTCDMAMQ